MQSTLHRKNDPRLRLFGRLSIFGLLICLPLAAANADFKVLHAFTGGADGGSLAHTLLIDQSGSLYGTTERGGASNAGTVFKLAQDGTETVLYSFAGGSDGDIPEATLLMDDAGNLYGTSIEGGVHCLHFGCGTAFKLTPGGTKTLLHAFLRRKGDMPPGPLIIGESGDIYVAANSGGTFGFVGGSILKLRTDGTAYVLHAFGAPGDGAGPSGIIRVGRDFYGTTEFGGAHEAGGTVFSIRP